MKVQTSADPGVFRDTVVAVQRHSLSRMRYFLATDGRLSAEVHREALEVLRHNEADLLVAMTDFLLERIGYDVGEPSEDRFSKTRRKVRAAVGG